MADTSDFAVRALDGSEYTVRVQRAGDFVVKTFHRRARALPTWLVVRSIEQLRRLRRRGWQISLVRGPIRHSRFNYTPATMVHREYIADEAAIPAAVEDLTARVVRGEVPSPATGSRLRPGC